MVPRISILMAILVALCASGCGYTFGPRTVRHMRTVHVSIVQSDSFRRNMDYLLTEAIQREVRTRSGYQLADEHIADTVLRARIVNMRKDVLSETRFDDAREVQLNLGIQAVWTERRSGRVLQQRVFPVGRAMSQHANVSFAPELGHSMATAQQKAAERLAAEIVDMMEMPW